MCHHPAHPVCFCLGWSMRFKGHRVCTRFDVHHVSKSLCWSWQSVNTMRYLCVMYPQIAAFTHRQIQTCCLPFFRIPECNWVTWSLMLACFSENFPGHLPTHFRYVSSFTRTRPRPSLTGSEQQGPSLAQQTDSRWAGAEKQRRCGRSFWSAWLVSPPGRCPMAVAAFRQPLS